jgi:hypothetical protein
VTVDRVAVNTFLGRGFRVFVNDQLVAIKVEVDPLSTGAPFFKSKDFTVKGARCCQIVNGDSEVERREAHQNSDHVFMGWRTFLPSSAPWVQPLPGMENILGRNTQHKNQYIFLRITINIYE